MLSRLHFHTLVRSGAVLALAALSVLGARPAAHAEPGQEVTFQFSPPDGLEFTMDSKVTKTVSVAGMTPQVEKIQARMRCTVAKTPDGYSIVYSPISGTFTRNGVETQDPLYSALFDATITYDVDAHGKLREVRGLSEAFARIREQTAKDMPLAAKVMAGSLSSVEKAMVAAHKAEWKGKVTSLVGRRCSVGSSWKGTESIETPVGGAISVSAAARLVGREKRGETECVRIVHSFKSDSPALRQQAAQLLSSIARSAGAPAQSMPKILALEVSGGGERVMDPATMLFHSEAVGRSVKMTVVLPKRGNVDLGKLQILLKERQVDRYDYGKGSAGGGSQASPLESGGGGQ